MPMMPRSVALADMGRRRSGESPLGPAANFVAGEVASTFSPPAAPAGSVNPVGAASGWMGEQIVDAYGLDEPAAAPSSVPGADEKRAARATSEKHAASSAVMARSDPSGGTPQGGSAPSRGTGTVATRTTKSGGVTTGEPGDEKGPSIRVSVPGRGMEEYDPDDPTVAAAFAQQRGGKSDFMPHRERTAPAPPKRPFDPTPRVGPTGASGRPVWTESAVHEADQIANWDAFLKGRAAEQQAFNTGMAESRARETKATLEADQPYYREELAAKARIGEAAIKAEQEGAQRQQILSIMRDASQQINRLRQDPRYQALDPAARENLEDDIWNQAQLTLSALTRTNLYPRPDPYAALLQVAPAAPAPGASGS